MFVNTLLLISCIQSPHKSKITRHFKLQATETTQSVQHGRHSSAIESKLRTAIRSKDWKEASSLSSEWIVDTKNSRTAIFTIVETCRRTGQIDAIFTLLLNLNNDHYSISTEDDILPFIADKRYKQDLPKFINLINFLSEKKMKFSAKTFSILLRNCESLTDIENTIQLMISLQVQPDIILINGLIDSLIRCGKISYALQIFKATTIDQSFPYEIFDHPNLNYSIDNNINISNRQMGDIQNSIISCYTYLQPYQIPANIRTLNTILKGLSVWEYNGLEMSLKLLKWMVTNTIYKPDSISINTVIHTAVVNDKINIAEELITRPLAQGIQAGVEAYTDLINAYAHINNAVSAERMYELMKIRNIQPNDLTMSVLMSALINGHRIDSAKTILQTTIDKYETSERTDHFTTLKSILGSYIVNICKLSMTVESNLKENRDFDSSSTDESINTDNSSLESVSSSNEDDVHVYDSIDSVTRSPTFSQIDTINTMKTQEDYLNEARSLILISESLHIPIDVITMNTYLQALADSTSISKIDDILYFYYYMIQQTYTEIQPNAYTYSILFTALGRSGHMDVILKLFQSADTCISQIDITVINSILRAFIDSDRPLDALTLYFDLLSQPNTTTTTTSNISNSQTKDMNDLVSNQTSDDGMSIKSNKSKKSISKSAAVAIDTYNQFINQLQQSQSLKPNKVTFTILYLAIANALKQDNSALNKSSITSRSTGERSSNNDAMTATVVTKSNTKKIVTTQQHNLLLNEETGRFYEADDDVSVVITSTDALTSTSSSTTDTDTSGNIALNKQHSNIKNDLKTQSEEDSSIQLPNQNIDMIAFNDWLRNLYTCTTTSNSGSNSGKSNRSKGSKTKESSTASSGSSNTMMNTYLDDGSSDTSTMLLNNNMKPNQLIARLYREMRFFYSIEPDDIMVSVLKALFAMNIQMSRLFITRETAIFIFEDLIVGGYNPSKMIPILRSCGYNNNMNQDFLQDNNSIQVQKLRKSSVSNRIFKKYQWNEMKSGWNPFF